MKESREIIKTPLAENVSIERPFDQPIAAPNGRYPGYADVPQQEGLQIIDYWRAIRKRLWLVVGITVLLTTLAAIYMARKPDIFQAQATVQVDLEQVNPDLVTTDRPIPMGNPDPAYFNTQLQLIDSETLLRRVILDLSLDSHKEFQKAKNQKDVSALRAMLKAVGLSSDEPDKKSTEDNGVGEVDVSTDSKITSSEDMQEAVRLAPYVEILKRNLSIEPVRESRQTNKDTRLIEIYYRNEDREFAALIVNGIAVNFTKLNEEKRFGTTTKTNEFLTERIATLQSEIKAGEEKLYNLKKGAGILKAEDESSIAMTRLSGLNKDLLEAENERKNAQAEYNAVSNSPDRLKSKVEEEMLKYTAEQESQVRALSNDIQKSIGQLKANRKRLLEEYQPTAQEIVEIDESIKTLENEIDKAEAKSRKSLANFRTGITKVKLDNLKTKYVQSQSKEDKIRSSFDEQYSLAEGQDQASVRIRLLEQDIKTKKGFLEDIENKSRGNDLSAAGTENNISVAEIAIPPEKPISPRRLTTVMGAFFLSTLFGMGLALFLEYLDDTIRTTEEVENYLQLPALAAIPTIDSMPKRKLLLVGSNDENNGASPGSSAENELLIHSDSRSSLAESFRQLRTSILLSTAGHPPKSLLVTSSLPAEGKTTTAINTAISLAQTGAKVLIVDADMRRPRLHSVFNISNAEGLSSLLASKFTDEQIFETVGYDEDANLHLLPSGPVPPNPAELIGSEQMSLLLKSLEDKYTHVVIDSPPIASFTDGVLVASIVDGVILVVHSGKSSRQVVKRSRQLLVDIGAKIFGVVLNNVNLKSQDNSYYYQSYYHRDSYRHDDE